MNYLSIPERKPDLEETEEYRGYTIELNVFPENPRTVTMYAYVTKGKHEYDCSLQLEETPIRHFSLCKEEASKHWHYRCPSRD